MSGGGTVVRRLEPHEDGSGSSRAATDALLGDLRAGRWRPAAWARFLIAASARSIDQARLHRRALAQVTALHGLFLAPAGGAGRRWVITSWVLASLHLGLLEGRADLGLANTLTLVRGNLPAVVPRWRPWLGVAAATTDLVDGKVARRTGTTSSFGSYADVFADAAFWIWFTCGRDDDHAVRTVAVLTWLTPVAVVTALSVGRGQMVESPRPQWVRPAATVQVLLALRALARGRSTGLEPLRVLWFIRHPPLRGHDAAPRGALPCPEWFLAQASLLRSSTTATRKAMAT